MDAAARVQVVAATVVADAVVALVVAVTVQVRAVEVVPVRAEVDVQGIVQVVLAVIPVVRPDAMELVLGAHVGTVVLLTV